MCIFVPNSTDLKPSGAQNISFIPKACAKHERSMPSCRTFHSFQRLAQSTRGTCPVVGSHAATKTRATVGHELIWTTKEYMLRVKPVKGEWLSEAGPIFFTVKESSETKLKNCTKERRKRKKWNSKWCGRAASSATARFMPKKRGRLGL